MAPPGLALPAPIYNCAYLEILFLSSSSSPRMASLHFLLPPAPRCIALSELHTSTALALSGSQSKSSVGRCVDDIPCDCRYDRRIDDVSEGSTGDGCCFTLSWEVHKNRGVNCIPDDKIALQAGQAPCGPSNGVECSLCVLWGCGMMPCWNSLSSYFFANTLYSLIDLRINLLNLK